MAPLPTDSLRALKARIAAARKRLAAAELLTGTLVTLGAAAAVWLLASVAEAFLWMPTGARSVLLSAILLFIAGVLFGGVLWPLLRWARIVQPIRDDEVARRIGHRFPDVRDRLLNLLQLLDGRHSEAPDTIVAGAAQGLGQRLGAIDFRRVEDFSKTRKAVRLASVPIAGLAAAVLLAPGLPAASARLLSPATEYSRPAPYAIEALPGDVTLVKGADLEVSAHLTGAGFPATVALETRFEDETVVERVDLGVEGGVSTHTIVNIRRTILYRFASGGIITGWQRAAVEDRPVLGTMQLVLRPPAYTRIPPVALAENDGDITALAGTNVMIDARVSGPALTSAAIHFRSGARQELAVTARQLTGSFAVRRDDEWWIEAISQAGITNADPVKYRIRRMEDAAPQVTIESPEALFDLDESTEVPLGWRISDDFGFSALTLHYRLSESRFGEPADTFSTMPLPVADPRLPEQQGFLQWVLKSDPSLDPAPGDVFTYFLQVLDNDGFAGPKAARSAEHRLRLPSLTDRYESLGEAEDETEDDLQELAREAERIRDRFEELQEQLRAKPEADWQDERALEAIQQQQQEMERSVDEVTEQIESMTDEMERNDLVGEETLEMFRELSRVADEINSPELMEALKNLQEAMQEMDLQRMQQAMENFRFDEEQYQDRLERTLDLFKNLRVQKDLEEAARRAEDLAKTEEELARQTGQLNEDENPADAEQETPDEETPDEETPDEEARDEEARDEQSEGEQAEGEQAEGEQAEPGENETGESPQNDGAPKPDSERLAAEQERAAEDAEQLERKLQEIRERMEELRQAPTDSMENLEREMQSREMPEQMRENAEQLRQQQFSPAQQSQQQMSQQLRSMQQKLQEMQQGMQGNQLQLNVAALRRILNDVLSLSADQEDLRAEVQELAVDSPVLRGTAQQQNRLSDGLALVSDSLQSLAREVPQMGRDVQQHAGEALREMTDATGAMTNRAVRQAAGHQKGSMTHMNELALLLADLLDQMMSGQGGGGSMSMEQMMQQLQDMAGQQQQLNQQIQQLLNDLQGNRLSTDVEARLKQLGGEQDRIRRQLQQLNRNNDFRDQALGDLERIAEQMQQTIEELAQREVSQRTVTRQQQILTRLLDASRSMQERGRERRRESQAGEDVQRDSPAGQAPSERAQRLRRDLIRALESGYAPDFEELIRRYFEVLQEQSGGSPEG